MRLPWTYPGASGEAPRIGVGGEWISFSAIAALPPQSLLTPTSPVFREFERFANKHHLSVRAHRNGDAEVWSFEANIDGMLRTVPVVLKTHGGQAQVFDIEVGSFSFWYAADEESGGPAVYPIKQRYRWFGLASESPRSLMAETLELALADAELYGVDDLDTKPLG